MSFRKVLGCCAVEADLETDAAQMMTSDKETRVGSSSSTQITGSDGPNNKSAAPVGEIASTKATSPCAVLSTRCKCTSDIAHQIKAGIQEVHLMTGTCCNITRFIHEPTDC
eukprot:scaffold323511_cov45-Prasinocladus_malaysianus.AAC.1